MDIVERLRREEDALDNEAADEIERLREEVAKWKRLDSEAANYVESVICMKSRHFTGEPPYVGWKGLGLALSQDYAEIERLREALNKMQRSRDRYRQAWETEKTRSTILQKERGDESYQ